MLVDMIVILNANEVQSRSYFKAVRYDVLLLVMVHLLACGGLSYLFVVSPELGSTLQT